MAPRFRRVWKDTNKKDGKPGPWKRVWQRIKYPSATHYSPNFTKAELDCKCGCKTPPRIAVELGKLARDLEVLRAKLGRPLGVLSGYRCPAHNKAVGGARLSQHMTGKAADIKVPAGSQHAYVDAAKKVPAFRSGGIGVYANGGVHVDRRGWVARWNSWVRS